MCGIRIVAARHAAALDANAKAAAAASSMNAEQHRGSRKWAAPLSRRSHCMPATDRRKRRWEIKWEKVLCAQAEGQGGLESLDGELV